MGEKYKDLTRAHPTHEAEYWSELRALYGGGGALLRDEETLARLFPRNQAEDDGSYKARMARAEYVNYAGSVVDYIAASLFAEPLSLSAEPPADPFFDVFQASVDGHAMSLTDLLKHQALTALQLRTAWTLVDLPTGDVADGARSEGDQEAMGGLRAYAMPVDPEDVLDWDETTGGALDWAIVRTTLTPRKAIADDRSTVTERFTRYTREGWERYEVTYKKGRPPRPNADIPRVDGGPHSFGQVPLVRMQLPKALWAMDQLHNLAKSHLNKNSGLSWSEYRHFFPILSAHLAPAVGPEGVENESAQDPGRATNQVYGAGRIIVLGDKDQLKYTSPDPDIYTTSAKRLDKLRDEMYRVVHQMALAIDNTGAGLRRSAESKQLDRTASSVVLTVLGEHVRQHAVELFALASRGRQDNPPRVWTAHGMQNFDMADLTDVVKESVEIDTMRGASQTFQIIRTYNAMKRIIKGNASAQDLAKIRAELEANIDISVYGPPGSQPQPVDGEGPSDSAAPTPGVAKGVAETSSRAAPAGSQKELEVGGMDKSARTARTPALRTSGTGSGSKGSA